MKRLIVLGCVALVMSACGQDEPSGELPLDTGAGASGGTCLEGTEDCVDTPFIDGEPQDGLPPSGGSSGMPASGGGLSVSEALASDSNQPILVQGFFVDSGDGPRLCEALAESFPPQCGGASIPMSDTSAVDPDSIEMNQIVRWSNDLIMVVGTIVDGVLVPTEMSL
jgi:hypothetical protein